MQVSALGVIIEAESSTSLLVLEYFLVTMKSFLRFALILLCLEGMDTFQFQPQKPSPTVKESQHESVNCRRTFVSSFGLVAASVVLGKPKDANAFSTSE